MESTAADMRETSGDRVDSVNAGLVGRALGRVRAG